MHVSPGNTYTRVVASVAHTDNNFTETSLCAYPLPALFLPH